MYRYLAGLVAVVGLCSYCYLTGARHEANKRDAAQLVIEKKNRELERAKNNQNDRIITKYIQTIEEVKTYAKPIENLRVDELPSDYRMLHDAAAANREIDTAQFANAGTTTTKEFANTCVENYATYHQVAAQLVALQDWVKLQ